MLEWVKENGISTGCWNRYRNLRGKGSCNGYSVGNAQPITLLEGWDPLRLLFTYKDCGVLPTFPFVLPAHCWIPGFVSYSLIKVYYLILS